MSRKLLIVFLFLFLVLSKSGLFCQTVTVDEFCLSNSFAENGTFNGRPLYGPIAGISVFWNGVDKWLIGSTDGNKTYYTSADNSTGPGCTPTFEWTPTAGFDCMNLTVSGISCSIVLPVTYNFFEGERTTENIELTWETSSEVNSDKFIIERSSDGRLFQAVGVVNAKGYSYDNIKYTFQDRNFIQNEDYYYRLKQLDLNGQYEYSDKVFLKKTTSRGELVISTNSESEFLIYNYGVSTDVDLKMLALDGRLIWSKKLELLEGQNHVQATAFPIGLYAIQVVNKNGTFSTHIVQF